MADWSQLPKELLDLISRKIDMLSDYRRFGAVCSSWRSVVIENPGQCQFQSFPKLVIPGETKKSETRRCLQPIPDDKGYFSFCESINEKVSQKQLPVPHQYYCCGSNRLGWLVLINNSFEMQLFNPLSEVKFKLPSSKTLPPANYNFTRFCKYYVNKAVISSDPTSSTSSQTIILIIYAGAMPRLAFCKLGDETWTPIETPNQYYLDVIYYKDKFYAVYNRGGCDIIDIDNQAAVSKYALCPPEELYTLDLYIIESKGELYLAVRIGCFDSDGDSGSDIGSDSGGESDEDDNLDDDGHNDFEDNKSDNSDRKSHEDDDESDDDGHNDAADNESDSSDHKSHEDEDDSDDDDDDHNHGADNENDNNAHKCQCHEINDDDDDHNDGTDSESDISDYYSTYRTVRFRVYKLEEGEEDGIKKWTRTKNIGDNAFFVGYNNSFSLQATDYNGCCKPNSIYFTDSGKPLLWIIRKSHDIGIFNLENKSVESIFPVDSKPWRPPPFWFTPNV